MDLTTGCNKHAYPPVPISADQPTGSRDCSGINQQLRYDYIVVVQTRMCCLKAWEKIALPGQMVLSVFNRVQSANETYVEFITRLKEVLQKTVCRPELRDLLLQMLSFDSANSECKTSQGH